MRPVFSLQPFTRSGLGGTMPDALPSAGANAAAPAFLHQNFKSLRQQVDAQAKDQFQPQAATLAEHAHKPVASESAPRKTAESRWRSRKVLCFPPPKANIRAGLMRAATGCISEIHDPTFSHGLARPEVKVVTAACREP